MATSLKNIGGVTPHPSVLKHDKDHPLYIKEVLTWIDHNKALASEHSRLARRGDKDSMSQRYIHEGYVKDIRHYLRTGDWISDFFGKNQEHKIKWRSA
jgi:hypothetical protein